MSDMPEEIYVFDDNHWSASLLHVNLNGVKYTRSDITEAQMKIVEAAEAWLEAHEAEDGTYPKYQDILSADSELEHYVREYQALKGET